MKNKIVFILSAVQDTHALKRIEEFIDSGYGVEVYGFTRSHIHIPVNNRFQINILGQFTSERKYLSRVPGMCRAFKELSRRLDRNEIVYYFGLDVALLGRIFLRNRYIYEECDLLNAYFKNPLISQPLKWLDQSIIKKSLETVLTSDGFKQYHFGTHPPANLTIIPNKLNPWCLNQYCESGKTIESTDSETLRIGFVGMIRAKAVYNFVRVFAKEYPKCEFHFFGIVSSWTQTQTELLEQHPNVTFHGGFNNPVDLTKIYNQIDIVLATYDTDFVNPRYAEPNKLYEAIFYETPIIVSSNTFLADKVKVLGVGLSVDAMNDQEVISLIAGLTGEQIAKMKNACRDIPKEDSINNNQAFFAKLQNKLSEIC